MAGLVARLLPTVAVGIAALLLSLVGLGFLCAAVYLALRGLMPAPAAAAASAAVALLLALLVLAIGRLCAARRGGAMPAAGTRPQDRSQLPLPAFALAAQLGEQAAAFARMRPLSAAALSLLAGVTVGASPRLRLVLAELLRAETNP